MQFIFICRPTTVTLTIFLLAKFLARIFKNQKTVSKFPDHYQSPDMAKKNNVQLSSSLTKQGLKFPQKIALKKNRVSSEPPGPTRDTKRR